MSYDKDSEGKKLMRINREVPFLSYPSWKLHSKKVIHRTPWQSSVSKISSKKWGISDHSCLSLLYKQNKEISTMLLQKYTPQYYPTQTHCFIRYNCSLIKGFLFAINFNNKRSQWTKLAFSRQL